MSQVRNQREARSKQSQAFNGLRSVVSQKTELFITTAVRTSNPTSILMTYFKNGGAYLHSRIHLHGVVLN
jgi:hypothetical protein